jgi:hypothetical protein
MNTSIKFHKLYNLGMAKGNKNKVFTKRGTQLTIKVNSKDNSRYVTLSKRKYNKPQYLNVDKLYFELFLKKKREVQERKVLGCSDYSKSELRDMNRYGIQSPLKGRDNLISVSGYFLRGKHRGKKVSVIPTNNLKWYLEEYGLKNNEVIVVREELKRREK